MNHRPSRRESICDAALELAAEGGNHAVTHQAIDRRLGLAKGSTSYYFRTRDALVAAAVTRLADRSREEFVHAYGQREVPSADAAAGLIAGQLHILLTSRRVDALARYALAVDAAGDPELRGALGACLFSVPLAAELMEALGASDPHRAAHDLVSLLEGLLFDLIHGSRSAVELDEESRVAQLRSTIRLWLGALTQT
ncbi:TetR/AcrR family transcriptional regulator [Rhodococcus sp. BE178]|uniref:TetR/AcrR family transcriptional regulator n=1 Tax=Rhodococcus sp. BE178 TaxID=2817737 RepID=UPI003D230F46